ncbi:MAG: tetraacyldisaccharide 4'-kinase [Flavobacteriales bacterium]
MFIGSKWLKPIGGLYGLVLRFRHFLFDSGIFKPQLGKLPTIVIGNLSLGGTGKTPHAEYILRQLSTWCKPALLSRGYGRKSSGFIWANQVKASASLIGDEPMQIHRKFPDLDVAVCENRLRGIALLKSFTNSNIVVLDDAFQHRRLQGDLNILLTRFDRPYWKDSVVPGGSLRDNKSAARRADIIIVTKCPLNISTEQQRNIRKEINPKGNQQVFFTTLQYDKPVALHGGEVVLSPGAEVVGIAGLADNSSFQSHLEERFKLAHFESFSDHHIFSRKEIESVWSKYGTFAQAIVTTEKDAVRLREIPGLETIPIVVVPISISFLSDEQAFRQLLRST